MIKLYIFENSFIDPAKMVPWLRKMLIARLSTFGKRASGKGRIGLARHLERAGGYAPNSVIWKEGGKGGKRVFYDTGAWRNAPTYEVIPPTGDDIGAVKVGFINDTAHPSERSSIGMKKLAERIAKGSMWTPTIAQRRMFWARINIGAIQDKVDTTQTKLVWTQPPRDFTKHLRSAPVIAEFRKVLDAAVQRYLNEKTRKR